MKSICTFLLLSLITYSAVVAQTPIDELQKQNIDYLKAKESEGYEFRSQIITEFDIEHATQHVNIKLSADFTYLVVALSDTNISGVGLDIKPTKKAKVESLELDTKLQGQAIQLIPSKSGRFKISIDASGLQTAKNGFVSFMVLRK